MATKANSSGSGNGQNLQFYYEEWQAFDAMITALTDRYTPLDFPRKNTVLHLLKSLQAFAADQFKFFYYGFVDGQAKPPMYNQVLVPSSEFPATFVLNAILDQIGHDLEIIQRAADQRILGGEKVPQTLGNADKVLPTLANADKLAWMAVKPAIDYAVVEEATTVLTYFQKSTGFYRIPYAQVALIGIPFTCTSEDNHQDYLAIPHEVGHYVFRHKTGDAAQKLLKIPGSLKEGSQAFRDWIKAIFEEMFADIYGCLIAGPVMALDMQDMSLVDSQREFTNGDGKHPNPVLRPYIYCQVLRNKNLKKVTQYDWQPIAEKLSAHWDDQVKQRGAPVVGINTVERKNQGEVTVKAKSYKISQVISSIASQNPKQTHGPLDVVVNEIADNIIEQISKYRDYGPIRKNTKLLGWAGEITDQTEVSDLYDLYEDNFDKLLAEVKLMPPEADPSSVPASAVAPDAASSQLWLEWVGEENGKSKGQWPLQQRIPSGNAQTLDQMPTGTWGHILWADGWTTGGPTNDPGRPFVSG